MDKYIAVQFIDYMVRFYFSIKVLDTRFRKRIHNQTGAPEHFEFWRGKILKGSHLSEVLGEGAKWRSVGGGVSPSHGRDYFKNLEYKIPSLFLEHFKDNIRGKNENSLRKTITSYKKYSFWSAWAKRASAWECIQIVMSETLIKCIEWNLNISCETVYLEQRHVCDLAYGSNYCISLLYLI